MRETLADEKRCRDCSLGKRKYWNNRTWWAGFIVLMVSLAILALCTFLKVENRELIEIWKVIFFTSLGYVVGIPVGTEFSRA